MKTKTSDKIKYWEKDVSIRDVKVDNATRMVEGYFADFDTLDSDLDIIRRGAFAKSIEEHGPASSGNRKVANLKQHLILHPIGDLRSLFEDDKGLGFRSFMGRHVDGNDALMMYEDNIIKEHSIGFNYLEEGLQWVDGDTNKGTQGFWNVTEVKLWEGSYITFGANENTPNLSAIKSQADVNNQFDSLIERLDVFQKCLKDKRYSVKFNNMADLELLQIQKGLMALKTFEPQGDIKRKKRNEPKPKENLFKNLKF